MQSTTSVHTAILAALRAAGVHAVPGPALDLPRAADGRVAPAAVVWPSARLNAYRRTSGGRSGGDDRATVVCVGPTSLDALAVADKVDAALGGLVLSDKGGPLAQTNATTPAPEPNADPVRVSLAVEYTATMKGAAVTTTTTTAATTTTTTTVAES